MSVFFKLSFWESSFWCTITELRFPNGINPKIFVILSKLPLFLNLNNKFLCQPAALLFDECAIFWFWDCLVKGLTFPTKISIMTFHQFMSLSKTELLTLNGCNIRVGEECGHLFEWVIGSLCRKDWASVAVFLLQSLFLLVFNVVIKITLCQFVWCLYLHSI